MKTIKSSSLISLFQKMYKEKWSYILGSAEEGCVDCSGAFSYAFKQLGGSAIDHGSNSIYHKWIGFTSKTPSAGYAAFKVIPWTDSEEDRGNRWYGKEPGNVKHIGLVDEDTRYVLNAKGTRYGFCRDKAEGYTVFAPLRYVDYGLVVNSEETEEEEMEELYKAVINTENDGLTLRRSASRDSQKISSIPKGETVSVVANENGWSKVSYGKLSGYVSSAYLKKVDSVESADSENKTTTLINTEGASVTLIGDWRVAED